MHSSPLSLFCLSLSITPHSALHHGGLSREDGRPWLGCQSLQEALVLPRRPSTSVLPHGRCSASRREASWIDRSHQGRITASLCSRCCTRFQAQLHHGPSLDHQGQRAIEPRVRYRATRSNLPSCSRITRRGQALDRRPDGCHCCYLPICRIADRIDPHRCYRQATDCCSSLSSKTRFGGFERFAQILLGAR
jgi:hypothetical protein